MSAEFCRGTHFASRVRMHRPLVLAMFLAACGSDPRAPYDDALRGSRWQISFTSGTTLLGCSQACAAPPMPITGALPSGDLANAPPGCTGALSLTVSDPDRPFHAELFLGATCDDGSTLECTGENELDAMSCRRLDHDEGLLRCGCELPATALRVE